MKSWINVFSFIKVYFEKTKLLMMKYSGGDALNKSFVYCCLLSGLMYFGTADAAPKTKKSKAKPAPAKVVEATPEDIETALRLKVYFERGYHIEKSLETLEPYSTSTFLKEQKLISPLIKFLQSSTATKVDRTRVFEFLLSISQKTKSEDSVNLLKILIKLSEDIRSPSLSSTILESFYQLKPSLSLDIVELIVDLQNDVLEDMINPVAKQKYNHQDYVTTLIDLKQSQDSKSKALLIKALDLITEKEIYQFLRIQILDTLASVTLTPVGEEAHFDKLENREIFSAVLKLLKKKIQKFQKPEELLEEDLLELEHLLRLTENQFADPNNTKDRQDVYQALVKIFKLNEPKLSEMAGQTLVNSQVISIYSRLTVYPLTKELLSNVNTRVNQLTFNQEQFYKLKESMVNDSPESAKLLAEISEELKKSKELNIIALECLSSYAIALIGVGKYQSEIVTMLQELKNQFYSQKDIAAKSIILKSFTNFDLDLVQSKEFPVEALKVLNQMFEICFSVLDAQSENEALLKMKEEIAKNLSEMSGAKIGPYADQWRDWRKSPLGNRYFKRLSLLN